MNTARPFNIFVYSVLSSLILAGCGKKPSVTPARFLNITVNNSSSSLNILAVTFATEPVSGHTRNTIGISGTVQDGMFSFGVYNWDFQHPPSDGVLAKDYTNIRKDSVGGTCMSFGPKTTLCDGGAISIVSQRLTYVSSLYKGAGPSSINIQLMDTVRHEISGKFDVGTTNSQGDTIRISSTFANLPYSIVN